MGYSNMQTNILLKKQTDGTSITVKSSSTWLEKQDIILKKINYGKYLIPRFFFITFLPLFFLFLQNMYKFQNDINLKFQFKNINSRNLAEWNRGASASGIELEDPYKKVDYKEVLTVWKAIRDNEGIKLSTLLENLLDDLFEQSNIHGIDTQDRNGIWLKFASEVYELVRRIDHNTYHKIYSICEGGSCTRESYICFINENSNLWESFRCEIGRIWHSFLKNNLDLLDKQVVLIDFNSKESN
ncbi:Plasmodium exported protein (PHIST), unknown function [Plasmodium relictum]|uniref:Plasmodium RESA N-terminal domain-containing protein n=1 Tax=Plasmodium relictum TaxID=85471 RepID=A0A1J1GJR6_PLARL|nr:Plasmodium exported protein (PHIST), unknown function [Plasmodium relictum]CRG83966.1 Plasmodium exported protein (PHIST), unknown function [Plasmodium relictum]